VTEEAAPAADKTPPEKKGGDDSPGEKAPKEDEILYHSV